MRRQDIDLVVSAGFEPATSGLGNLRSIQLNYETNVEGIYGMSRNQILNFSFSCSTSSSLLAAPSFPAQALALLS